MRKILIKGKKLKKNLEFDEDDDGEVSDEDEAADIGDEHKVHFIVCLCTCVCHKVCVCEDVCVCVKGSIRYMA